MGSWGDGIYENDNAAEILIALYDDFESKVASYLDSDNLDDLEPDSMAPHILTYLDLIRMLAEGAKRTAEGTFDTFLFPYRIPTADRLAIWKAKMVKAHVDSMDDLYRGRLDGRYPTFTPKEELREYSPTEDGRLSVINSLFDRLIELSKSAPPLESDG